MEGNPSGHRGQAVYCVVPGNLEARVFDLLRSHFASDPEIHMVVERRAGERRAEQRRSPWDGRDSSKQPERRRIARSEGRRVGDRRMAVMPVAAPALPRKARRLRDRIVFLRRMEPASQMLRDQDADRLVLRHQAGDPLAMEELYTSYFEMVYSYARIALRDHHEAEDVTQSAFARVIESVPGYEVRAGSPFRAWLMRIARNLVVDAARLRERVVPQDPAQLDRRRDGQPSLSNEALTWLSDSDVALFVQRLTEAQKEALVLRYLLDLSLERAGEVMGRSPDAVRKLVERALSTLEQRLRSIGRTTGGMRRSASLKRKSPAPVMAARRFAIAYGRPWER